MDLRKSQVFQWKYLRLEPHKSWDIKIFFFHVTLDVWNQFIFNVRANCSWFSGGTNIP